MVAALLIAGMGLLLAGLLTVGYGILLDLSLGNTLILAGAIVACTGGMMLGLWMVVRELKNIARRLGPGMPMESAALSATLRNQDPEDDGFLFSGDQPVPEHPGDAAPPPWHEEAGSRDRGRGDAPAAAAEPVEAAAKPRRNLLFSSTSRKERERAQARPAPAPAAESGEAPPVTFDDAWPKSERARAPEVPSARRGGRAPSNFTEANAAAVSADQAPPMVRHEEQPQVTVLKSGVVDGMAYSLYSDGSIEAQMPEGMMRFASIDELRAHLDQRP